MDRDQVLVAALNGYSSAAQEIRSYLAAAWSGDNRFDVRFINASDFHNEPLDNLAAVILRAGADVAHGSALEILHRLEEAGVPIVAVLDGEPQPDNVFAFAGAMVKSADTPPQQMCAIVEGILHRQEEVHRLRDEAALSQRFHGGLKGQIAKMHEELQLAALVQREFLPRNAPTVHGVEFGSLWRPSNYVSGDIYDIIRLDEDHVGVFVADAVGHGVPAALMTMVICRSLITKEIVGKTYRLVEPAQVLHWLNMEMIRRQGRTTRFATAVYAVINCRERTVKLAGAGHPPPVRLACDGTSEVLETEGGLLGVFPDETYDQREFELAVEDRIIFYTDGFEQAFPADESDAYERRLPSTRYRNEFLQLANEASALEMIDTIGRRIDDQAGSLHQIDDLTLVCLHAGPLVDSTQSDGEEPISIEGIDAARSDNRRGGLRLAS